jgi:hypothetical protein
MSKLPDTSKENGLVVEAGQAPWRLVFDVLLIGGCAERILKSGDPIDQFNHNLILSAMAAFTISKT